MGFLKMIGLVVVVLVLGFWLPFLFRVLPWWCRDIYRYFKYPRKIHLYGIWLYCGLYGQGKTMALTEYLTRMRKKYGDKIYICTNLEMRMIVSRCLQVPRENSMSRLLKSMV